MKQNNLLNTTAQTQLDFVVGIGIFLVAFSVVLAGAGSLLQPFSTGQENIVATDRIADSLTNSHLTTDDRQYKLDKECTTTFFAAFENETMKTAPDDCRFNSVDGTGSLNEVFGVDSTYYVNISIESPSGIVTMNGTRLAAGTVPDTGTVTLSQRIVRIENTTYYAYVRVTR